MSSNIVINVACPTCVSNRRDSTGNHLMVFKDGGARCIKGEDCGHVEPKGSRDMIGNLKEGDVPVSKPSGNRQDGPLLSNKKKQTMEDVEQFKSLSLPARKLKAEYLSIFGIKVEVSESTGQPHAYYFPRHREGKLVGYKKMLVELDAKGKKKMFMIGDGKECDIFGQHLDGGRKMLILTEGELDAVAVKQSLMATDPPTTWRVASLSNGANTTFSESTFKWLDSFETIKVMTDHDEEGDNTAEALAAMFPGKTERVILPENDANECLMKGQGKEIKPAINNSRKMTLGGIIDVSEAYKGMVKSFLSEEARGIPYPYPLEALNEVTVGLQTSKLDIIGSGVGQGKTTLLRLLLNHLTQTHGEKSAVLSFEETAEETAIGQMSMEAQKPLHHPLVRESLTTEYLEGIAAKVFDAGNFFIIDHSAESGISDLYSKLKFMRTAYGVKYFFLDPLGMIVKGIDTKETDTNGQVESVMRNLAGLCKSLDIYIGVVSHGRKASSSNKFGPSFERGAVMDLDDLLGSSAIKQYAQTVLVLARDQGASDPTMRSTVLLTLRKNRPMSTLGPQCTYMYDIETGLLVSSPIDVDQWTENLGAEGKAPSFKGKGK